MTHRQTVYVPVEEEDGEVFIPAQDAKGAVEVIDGEPLTTLYGTQLGSNYAADPVLGMVRFLPDDLGWVKGILGPWVGILAATILVIARNAGLIGVSRLTYSLGLHRQLPPILSRMHAKRMTPYVSIIVFGTIACFLMIRGNVGPLVDLYVFGSMISFTAAHVSLVVLRIKEPDLERPWRVPFNIRVKGRLLPLTAILGGLGTAAVWVVIVSFQSSSRLIGFLWFGVGLLMYLTYRKAKGYSLTKSVATTMMPESMQDDVDYHQILVPIVGSRVTDVMMVLACQLATEKKSSIDGLYVIEVPLNLPLDAKLTRERAKADETLKAAALIASQFKVKFTPHVVAARQAGRAIVEEATLRRSEVIILGTMRIRRIRDQVFGHTSDYVLDHAPCEVLLNLVPREVALGKSGAGGPVSPESKRSGSAGPGS